MQVENLSFMCHKTEVQLSAKRAKVSNLHCDVFMDWKALIRVGSILVVGFKFGFGRIKVSKIQLDSKEFTVDLIEPHMKIALVYILELSKVLHFLSYKQQPTFYLLKEEPSRKQNDSRPPHVRSTNDSENTRQERIITSFGKSHARRRQFSERPTEQSSRKARTQPDHHFRKDNHRRRRQRIKSRVGGRSKDRKRRSNGTGRTPVKSRRRRCDEIISFRRQKPAKLVLNEPPLPGDRVGRPPMEKVQRRRQKPVRKLSKLYSL
ncbi:hypothetical protein YC2023_016520 [Brassica napus]